MASYSEDDERPDTGPTRPSKEQQKRRTLELRELVIQMLDLPAAQLEGLSLGDETRAAIVAATRMKRVALKRQIKYIVGLLRNEDAGRVADELQQLSRPHQQQVRAFHRIEQWRDELIGGNDELIDDLVQRFEHADRQHLRQLVRQARKQPLDSDGRQGSAARSLFRYLSELQQE